MKVRVQLEPLYLELAGQGAGAGRGGAAGSTLKWTFAPRQDFLHPPVMML